MAQIIFLHGASSCGKSTIARGLQAEIEKPFWNISIDHLRDAGVLPMDRFRKGDFVWADARAAFFEGFHTSLAAYANAGNNLILEHILDTEGWLEALQRLFAPHDVFFVAVHCPLPLLIQRESARGDRPKGSAKQDFETVHVGRRYDIDLNSEDDVDANVQILLAAWREKQRSSDFSL
ncbi:AAA family ATPase [Pseudovibrio sp. Tun.PSC04-5.I4]|uniref:chloramphenicol phosphotransferase CPT family protein n=1 Tax=Pseudovibrio sp. Tun.PSC04-5.I4 TaxID=1798213 RepID=UPI0008838DC7|nr:AAA family ATPase [Pseudovibrio sp. Tun.PSC04-5.I4]SDR28506.1 chloramphenicol 3-O phosphotransferase [Pseudovibrio sp. Tun.PSC04-5.I4]